MQKKDFMSHLNSQGTNQCTLIIVCSVHCYMNLVLVRLSLLTMTNLINCVMYYYLCVLRWLMRPILALNCLLQIKREVWGRKLCWWCLSSGCMSQRMTKPTKRHVRPAKTQISLGIRQVWSESSLSAWRKLGSLATHWVHSEDSDHTGQMPRLIWVFAGRICNFVDFVMRWLISTVSIDSVSGQRTA